MRIPGWLIVIGLVVATGCTEGQSAEPRTAAPEPDSTATEETPSPAANSGAVTLPDAENRTVAERLQDASRAAQITQALVRESSLRVFDFEVQVVGETALIQGDVNTKAQYEQAVRAAQGVSGIQAVQNELTVGGQSIEAVSESDGAAESTAVYHTVERGETLWDIAAEYNATVNRLRELNDGVGGLQPGQRLRVR